VIGWSHGSRSRQKPAEEEQMKKFARGAVAGAAGTTALNAVGYADMALRGRPASSVPARVAEQLARRVGGTIPGSGAARQNRLEGLGALAGIATGAGVGALAGQLPGALRRLGPLAGPAVIGGVAMLVTDLTTAGLGISDPRTWDAGSWLSDIVPHLAFGAVVYAALPEPPSRAAAPPKTPPAARAEGGESSQAGDAEREPGELASAEPAPPATPATPVSEVLQRAAALGAATGMRSTVALAALVLRRSDGLPAVLRHPAARRIAAIADGAELVADKLPGTPSRLDPPGLTGRLISASLAAAVLAHSENRGPIPAVLTASTAALAAARICHDARAALARRVPDPVVAVAEDALAIGLAAQGSG
jgi:uncharacterized membrane protein